MPRASKKPSSKPSAAEAYAAAVLLAAGSGSRLGARKRKGLVDLGGKPLYEWALHTLLASPLVGEVVLVLHAEDVGAVAAALRRRPRAKPVKVVPGGKERQDSVGHGLDAIAHPYEVVLVHDAARPFLNLSLVKACAEAARAKGAAAACVPVKDSIKLNNGQRLVSVPREHLLAAQTPQAFRFDLLEEAHALARHRKRHYTDEVSLAEAAHIPSLPVAGYYENFKVTSPEDLILARRLVKEFDFES